MARHGRLAISAQFGLLYIKKRLESIPHDHIPAAIGTTGPMACITCIYTTKPAVSRRVCHAGLVSWVIVSSYIQWWTRTFFLMDAYLHKFKLLIFMSVDFIACLDHSSYTPGRIAQSVVYRVHDPKIVGSILDSTQKYCSLRNCQK